MILEETDWMPMGPNLSGETGRPPPCKIFLAGDVMTGRGIDQILPHPVDPRIYEKVVHSALGYVTLAEHAHGPIPRPADFSYIWGDLLPELERAGTEARIVNLETCVTRDGKPQPKGINYRMSPDNVPCLTALKIDGCALANNHLLDWGAEGLDATLSTLSGAGIRHAGAGRNVYEASSPALIALPSGGWLRLFSAGFPSSGIPAEWNAGPDTPGIRVLEDLSGRTLETLSREIRRSRDNADITVLSLHWGANWGYRISPAQRTFAHDLIENAGVDIIHGHSSHHPKAIEVYRDKLILYGCGDLINDYEGIGGFESFRGNMAVGYLATLDRGSGRLRALELFPFVLRKFRLNRPSLPDIRWLLKTLDRESAPFGVSVRMEGESRMVLSWQERPF